MTQGLSVDTLIEVMEEKPALAERLAAHLPLIDPEDQQLTPSQAVIANVRSPQFKYALKVSHRPLLFFVFLVCLRV